jgi:CRP/FNR family transcriptional regulator
MLKPRLVLFLKDWAERGTQIGNKVIIENYLTQNDIAQIICTSRQTTTQLLNEMEAKGRCSTIEKKLL